MNRKQYETAIKQEIAATVDRLMPHGGGATVTEVRLRSALDTLAQRVASASRAYELLGVRTSEEMAEEWGVSERQSQAFIATLHERLGVGRNIGGTWVLSAAEAESYKPDMESDLHE